MRNFVKSESPLTNQEMKDLEHAILHIVGDQHIVYIHRGHWKDGTNGVSIATSGDDEWLPQVVLAVASWLYCHDNMEIKDYIETIREASKTLR